MPGWMVQYSWNVPGSVNGPIVPDWPPWMFRSRTSGAPGSRAGCALLPGPHVPLAMMCGRIVSATSVTRSPALMVMESGRNRVLSMCTVFGLDAALGLDTIAAGAGVDEQPTSPAAITAMSSTPSGQRIFVGKDNLCMPNTMTAHAPASPHRHVGQRLPHSAYLLAGPTTTAR